MAEMQCSPRRILAMTLLTVAPSSFSPPASKLIQSCSIPCRPPRSRTSNARRGRCSLGGSVCRERGLHPLNLPVRAARFLRRRRRSPTIPVRAMAPDSSRNFGEEDFVTSHKPWSLQSSDFVKKIQILFGLRTLLKCII